MTPSSAVRALPADPAVAPGADRVRPVGRYRWVPSQIEPVSGISDAVRGQRIAIVGGDDALAVAVVNALGAAGAHPTRLASPTGQAPADVVVEFLEEAGIPDGIVDLNIGGDLDQASGSDWEAPLAQTLALLQACHDSWIAETRCERHFYLAVTRMDGQMGFGGGPIAQPLGGLWAGLAKGLPRELPNCNIRVVDLAAQLTADPSRAASAVCGELYRWGLFEIGHRNGKRYTLSAAAAPVPEARTELRPGDTVLMSGGGRGIGFALALDLATTHGCRVFVTGRGQGPDTSDPVIDLSEADFREYRDRLLRAAAAERSVPAARGRLDQLVRDRAVHRNLVRAAQVGADIRYLSCDITDPTDVQQLIRSVGGPIAGVIHNAGIDVPVRLPGKDWATVRQVVRVKVQGLLNLLAALPPDAPPRFFCSVGSLTGRWGGMVGQLDYGAANEGLSRLGLWANQREGIGRTPVTTVAWPTWDRLGMITNYQATLRYMTAMDVTEGVAKWKAELFGGEGGEVTFIGDVGPAVVPGLLRGYPAEAQLPGIDRLRSILTLMGEPVEFRPYRSFTSRVILDRSSLPCAADATVGGRKAVPVSVCLEHLLAAADWVRPDTPNALQFDRLEQVDIRLPMLAPAESRSVLTKTAVGSWQGSSWLVEATLSVTGDILATGTAVYVAATERDGERPRADKEHPSCPGQDRSRGQEQAAPLYSGDLSWTGHAFELSTWCRHDDGGWHSAVGPDHPQDLFLPPMDWARSTLGFIAVENLVRASASAAAVPGPAARLRIGRLTVNHGAPEWGTGSGPDDRRHIEQLSRHRSAEGDSWRVDRSGRTRLLADGVVFHTTDAPSPNPESVTPH